MTMIIKVIIIIMMINFLLSNLPKHLPLQICL